MKKMGRQPEYRDCLRVLYTYRDHILGLLTSQRALSWSYCHIFLEAFYTFAFLFFCIFTFLDFFFFAATEIQFFPHRNTMFTIEIQFLPQKYRFCHRNTVFYHRNVVFVTELSFFFIEHA